jgi:gliding motility-associated-like protein
MQTVKLLFLSFLLFVPAFKGSAGDIKTPAPQNAIKFTENKKQWNKDVLYRAQLDGGVLFLEKNALIYNFYDKETLRENHAGSGKHAVPGPIRSHAFKTTFVNSLSTVETSAQQMSPDYCNYFLGKDKNKWAGNVRNFRELNYRELYKGVGLQVLGMENSVKYNFIVSPQGDANDIQLNYEGLENMYLDKGALVLKTSVNEIVEQHPFAFQWIGGTRVEVPCEFILEGTTVRFHFPGGFNKAYELTIDPILVFACSSGSTADNFGMTATYDAQGNLYSGGTCFDIGFPTTLGAYDVTFNGATAYGRTDVVVTKYDSSGSFLQYSTYIGGATGTEIVTSLVVDAQNNLLLYGATGSSDFPVTATAYDTSFGGGLLLHFIYNGSFFDNGTDIYVAKLDPAGAALLASTYIGGHMNDGVNVNNDSIFISAIGSYEFPPDSLQYNYGDQYRGEINVDQYGNAYIASSTRSNDFPIVNGFDSTLGGEQDAVAFKLNTDFSQLLWSTYLGGTNNDAGYALALDDSANVYITGGTRSNNFPATAGALRTIYGGGKADGYVTKIKKDGTGILFSTYWGTPAYDQTYFVQLDKDNDVYVVGQTQGAMPVTGGVYSNPNSGQFITKMNDSLSTMIFSTVFGNGSGSPNISPSAFLVDYCENIYVSGWGGNIITGPATSGMPITPGAIQPSSGDGFNFYLFVLSTNATSLLYATYFGGNASREHVDGGTSRFDKKGIIYQSVCAGCGGNDDFPVTPGSWPNTGSNVNHNTNCNNGTFKFDFQVAIADANFTVDYVSGCAPLTVQFQNQSTTGGAYLWDFGGGDTTSSVLNPVHVFPTPGTYMVQLLVNNLASCNVWDTALQYVTVFPAITADFDYVNVPCSNQFTFNDSSVAAAVSWAWDFDDAGSTSTVQNPTHIFSSAGSYDIQLIATNSNGCKDTTSIPITFSGATTSISPDDTICVNSAAGAQLNATGGFAYSWSPASSLSASNIPNPVAHPTVTTNYTVSISTINTLGDTCIQTQVTTVYVIDPFIYPLSATADADTILGGTSTIIHAITDTTLTVNWSPGIGLSSTTSFNPTASPEETTTYTVSILDSTGCPRTASVTIYVLSMQCNTKDVFVPNTFTPNGDGENDILFVRSNEVAELYFAVYNRWGQMVFETKDITKGWDGIYNGMKADPAVFAWYLRAKCFNGNEIKKKGNTTLIR